MEQEKFASLNQSSSKANMPRDTVETLKQIQQKQGLSISIINNVGGSSSTPVDTRSKASVLQSDKASKITPVSARPPIAAENKSQNSTARLTSITDAKVLSSVRVTTQSTFHEHKATVNQTRPIQSPVVESKGFNQVWNNPHSSVDKSQATVNRPVMATSVNKIQTSQVRVLMPENKTPVSRNSQSIHNESKSQVRISSGQRVPQIQQIIEGKIQNNQERVNISTSSEVKGFHTQGRTGQQFIVSQDKAITTQKVVSQKTVDVKSTNQLSTNKAPSVDAKSSQATRMTSNAKVALDAHQKARSNILKSDGKSNITGTSPMVVENKMVNSVRLVTNVVDGSATRTTQCKSSSTQMRLHPNASLGETQTAIQTKMICTAVHTKMICFQNVPIQPENKVIVQGSKVTAQTSSDTIQKTSTVFDMSAETLHENPRISTAKRSATLVTSPVKKKCAKRTPPSSNEKRNKIIHGTSVNPPEEGEGAGAHFFSNLKTSRTGLTITPVRPAVVSGSSASPISMARMPGELLDKDMHQHLGNIWQKHDTFIKSPRGKPRARGKRKTREPLCLTLSSDEEEAQMKVPFRNFEEAFRNQMFSHEQQESEGSKSGHSTPDEDNPESDDPQFPGVTDINSHVEEPYEDEEEEEDEEKEMDEEMDEEGSMGEEDEVMDEMDESDMEEEEEVPPEEEDETNLNHPLGAMTHVATETPLLVRSVRIGSFKIHPVMSNKTLNVFLASDGISFNSPMLSDPSKIVAVTIKPSDITHIICHFGKCLPILFVFTTASFGEAVRKSINMFKSDLGYFDPTSNDDKQQKLTFLIDSITDEQRRFLRHSFISEKKVREVDQKTANEILVKSTPSNNKNSNSQIVRCEIVPKSPPQPLPQPQHIHIAQENVVTITAIQPIKFVTQPVVKVVTYPPPPQTGGITITTEDLACLNEGEFLNDAIIDFYLKYVFYEKLSEYNREKTHIFSSYFYHRLTQKPERPRGAQDVMKNIQMRRHSQVKTWTRHVDIFSKDFIIIPVNQNVHWFLAIICYPGLVPDAPDSPIKSESKIIKCNDVTSSDDQEENIVAKENNSRIEANNQILDENSQSSNSMCDNEEPDSEEPMPEAPDSSTHPDRNRHRKEVPCICIFDSLNGPNRSRIATMLREYLEVEWKLKKGTRKVFDKTTMQGYNMQCPQQTNFSDCGIYVLQYVESFFENPLPYFDPPIPNLMNWFPKEKVAKKRQELKELILNLQKKYVSNSTIRNSNVSEKVPSSQTQVLQQQNDDR